MEKLFSLQYGVGGACVLLTLMIVLRLGEFLWKLKERKESLSDAAVRELTKAVVANTSAVHGLDLRLQNLEHAVSDLPKFKADIRRLYAAVREVAGEGWTRIRDEILKDEFPL